MFGLGRVSAALHYLFAKDTFLARVVRAFIAIVEICFFKRKDYVVVMCYLLSYLKQTNVLDIQSYYIHNIVKIIRLFQMKFGKLLTF